MTDHSSKHARDYANQQEELDNIQKLIENTGKALIHAASVGDLPVVKDILGEWLLKTHMGGVYLLRAVTASIQGGFRNDGDYDRILSALIVAGENFNVGWQSLDYPPLQVAASGGKVKCFDLLWDKGLREPNLLSSLVRQRYSVQNHAYIADRIMDEIDPRDHNRFEKSPYQLTRQTLKLWPDQAAALCVKARAEALPRRNWLSAKKPAQILSK